MCMHAYVPTPPCSGSGLDICWRMMGGIVPMLGECVDLWPEKYGSAAGEGEIRSAHRKYPNVVAYSTTWRATIGCPGTHTHATDVPPSKGYAIPQ